jgi:hypothetical protein
MTLSTSKLFLLTTSLENLVEVKLAPSDIWVETGKLPHTINLLVPMLVVAVGMTLDLDLRSCSVRVSLMRDTKLVPSNDCVVRDLLPLGLADEMLGHESFVSEDERVRNHLEVIRCWHGLPDLSEERAVVDLERKSQPCALLIHVIHEKIVKRTLNVGAMTVSNRFQSLVS